MVYCGRPSTACHACRARRGKCDRQKPGCSQCRRKKQICPGYTDPSAAVFRDQTEETVRKVTTAKTSKTSSAADDTSDASPMAASPLTDSPGSLVELQPLSSDHLAFTSVIPGSLPVAIKDAALDNFFKFYTPISTLSYLNYLSSNFATSSPPRAAILAPALAIFAQELNQPALLRFAVTQYSTALAATNLALSVPKRAMQDGTLGSIILLGLFEAFTFDGTKSPSSWTNHIDGALQLVKMRGDDQLETYLGRSLFIDVADCARISYHVRLQPVPPKLIRLENVLRKHTKLEGIMSHLSNGIATMIAGLTRNIDDPLQSVHIVAQGHILQTQIITFAERHYEKRPYFRIPDDDVPETAYKGIAHTYDSAQAARHWNGLRLAGLFVNKWIHGAARAAIQTQLKGTKICNVADMVDVMEEASAQVVKLADGVLGSVPYFLSQTDARSRNMAFARWLIWPLQVVASSELVSESARKYAKEQLTFFGHMVDLNARGFKAEYLSDLSDDFLHLLLRS